MDEPVTKHALEIKKYEEKIEKTLWALEISGENDQALAAYQEVEAGLDALGIEEGNPDYTEVQRVLAYCLMRQGNILRQVGKPDEAARLGEREISAARASGNNLTLARSLMSNGTNRIVAGQIEQGLAMIQKSQSIFESGKDNDYKQGVGWCWILRADLINAGLVAGGPPDVIKAADRALEFLQPIENWPGVARAFEARLQANERLGDNEAAASDRAAQQLAESKIKPDEMDQE